MDMIKDDIDEIYSKGDYNSVCAEYDIIEKDTLLSYRIKSNPQIKKVIVNGNKIVADSTINNFLEIDSISFGTISNFISNLDRLKNY